MQERKLEEDFIAFNAIEYFQYEQNASSNIDPCLVGYGNLLLVATGISIRLTFALLVLIGARFVVALFVMRGSPSSPALSSLLLGCGIAGCLALEGCHLAGDSVWTRDQYAVYNVEGQYQRI